MASKLPNKNGLKGRYKITQGSDKWNFILSLTDDKRMAHRVLMFMIEKGGVEHNLIIEINKIGRVGESGDEFTFEAQSGFVKAKHAITGHYSIKTRTGWLKITHLKKTGRKK